MAEPFDPYADLDTEPEAEEKTSWLDRLLAAYPVIKKYKTTIWSCLLLIAGALGGNVDRLMPSEAVEPATEVVTSCECEDVSAKIDELEQGIENLVRVLATPQPVYEPESGRINIGE